METSFQWNAKTKVHFLKKLPSLARLNEALGFKPEKVLLIYDRRVGRHPAVRSWLAEFTHTYPVDSGESLKEIANFPNHVKKIFKMISPFSSRSFCVLALGGGTVGDFAGFLGSVIKRGVPLVHIPSTLLAAMDSSHGGKTALNVSEFKNQVGSFYPADSVLIVRGLFEELPPLQIQSAGGELAKIALLTGGSLFESLRQVEFNLNLETVWDLLPQVIEAKYTIVEKDPFEQTGERQVLNFGHTLGHALESYYGLAHGVAVGQGMIFALEWSAHQGYLKQAPELIELLVSKFSFLGARDFAKKNGVMSRSRLMKMIVEDKKLTDARHISFIFLEKSGVPFRKVVTVESLLAESQRQGWTRL